MQMDEELLGQLSDDSLLEYIADLSQSHSQGRVPANSVLELESSGDRNYTRDQYFKDKETRQQHQDSLLREGNRRNGLRQIFQGCSIYINGYTKPGRLQLHELIVQYGGRFVHYLTSKKKTTHIIATNLPLKKRKEFANYKIVKPEWIVDSVNAGRLLPWQSYSHSWDQGQGELQVVDCTDARFLDNFFENSRLHHLSNWKSTLRQNFLGLNDCVNIPGKEDRVIFFHIDFDCFFASVAALDFPLLDIGKDPIVVCHGTHNSDISSCNYAARQYGIRNGMWVSDAKSRIPEGVKLNCLPYNFAKIKAKSDSFYHVLKKNHSVVFDQILPISIDESICVRILRDEEHLDLERICQELRQEIFRLTGCTVSIGCSNTLILSRLNLRKAKPDNFYILFREELDDLYFSDLSLTDLPGIGYSTLSKLNSINEGSRRFESLLQLKQTLYSSTNFVQLSNSRIGNKLTSKILLAIAGKDDDESLKMIYDPKAFFERKSLSIDINWGIRFSSIHEIDSFIDVCTKYLVEKLNELNKKTLQVNVKIMRRSANAPIEPSKFLGMGKCDSASRNSKLGIPTNEFGLLTTEIKNSFRCLSCPPKELRGISIQFNKLLDLDPSRDGNANRFLNFKVFENLPNDVKPNLANELKRRKIQVKEPKINEYQQVFLNEIPTQFRNEIKKDLIIKEKIEQSELNRIYEKRSRRETQLKNSKCHLSGNNNESLFDSIKFQNEKSFKKICSKLMRWIDFTMLDDGPHIKDVELFENYLDKLSDSSRVPLILRISKLISTKLNLKSVSHSGERGFQEWEKILMKIIIPKLNKNKHTFQTVRKLDLEFDL